MGRRGVVFCDVNDAPLLPHSLDRFPPNFPRTRGLGGGSRHVVSYSRKVPVKGSNLPKTPLEGLGGGSTPSPENFLVFDFKMVNFGVF